MPDDAEPTLMAVPYLCVHVCSPRQRVLELLKDEDPGSFADHKAVAIGVEGA